MTTLEPIRTPPHRAGQAASRRSRWESALTTGMVAGAAASLMSTLALIGAGRRETGSAAAPTNATSHWLWGRRAFRQNRPSLRYTLAGYLIHHLASTFWAVLYALVRGDKAGAQSVPAALMGAGAAAAAACVVDYTITPKRLTPGFEQRLSGPAMGGVYAAFAVGLALGCLLVDRAGPRR